MAGLIVDGRGGAFLGFLGRTLAREVDLLVDDQVALENFQLSGCQTGNLGQDLVSDGDLGSQLVLGQIHDHMAANEANATKNDETSSHSSFFERCCVGYELVKPGLDAFLGAAVSPLSQLTVMCDRWRLVRL